MRSFLFGLFAGIFLCIAAQQLFVQKTGNSRSTPQEALNAGNPEQNEDTRPTIDFYERLRNSEVLVPVPAPIEPSQAAIYFLQAASFRNPDDANRARAEILLLNLEAEITEFHNNGEVWHRIIVGPFEGQSMVSKAQTALLENGYGGMVMQPKK